MYIYIYIYIYILEEYWQIFVDDGLFPRDATDLQASAQPKAVFSYATTVMGKICCWDKEDKWGVSLYAACMSTTSVYCVMDRKTTQHFSKRRMMSIMESANWVCEEVLEEREWVSPLTIPLQEEKVSRESDNAIDVSLCGTMDISLAYCSLKINCGIGL